MEPWEVQRYGTDSFGDPDYVSIFGMRPRDWHARGIRLLGVAPPWGQALSETA